MKKTRIAILCGGKGKRLKRLTSELPKPLVLLGSKPILEHILNFFRNKGFNDFILCAGYKSNKIKDFIEKYNTNNCCRFSFSDLGEDASILQRIYALKDSFEDKIFCTYGDTLTELDIDGLFEDHHKKKALMTIVSSKIKAPFGLLDINDEGWARSFVEKPVFNYYIGHLIMEKEVVRLITEDILKKPDGDGLISLFAKVIEQKSLNVFKHFGPQITFNTAVERMSAEKDIINFYSQREEE